MGLNAIQKKIKKILNRDEHCLEGATTTQLSKELQLSEGEILEQLQDMGTRNYAWRDRENHSIWRWNDERGMRN